MLPARAAHFCRSVRTPPLSIHIDSRYILSARATHFGCPFGADFFVCALPSLSIHIDSHMYALSARRPLWRPTPPLSIDI